jgi:hypothetical protein
MWRLVPPFVRWLLNTNYATTYENTYQYSAGNTLNGGTWNNDRGLHAAFRPRELRAERLKQLASGWVGDLVS